MKFILTCIACLLISLSIAQDTISVMAYNLLKYNSTNSNQARFNDLKTIVQFSKPDVLLVCELEDGAASSYLLTNALNAAGVGTYTRAIFYDGPDTDNALFYKTAKIKLKSQNQIIASPRHISQYQIAVASALGDTGFIYLHMVHLKAGNSSFDENDRFLGASAFCNNITNLTQNQNVIIAGDFNVKSSSEAAWQKLTTNSCPHVFYDPINQPGFWNNDFNFSSIHTQSTRDNASPGCCGGSTGGLDDRFDFILTNASILNGTNKVKYVPGSYKAFGNDGQHFNTSLLASPTNTSVPANVNQALFNMSDHLPVLLKLAIGSSVISVKAYEKTLPFRFYHYMEQQIPYLRLFSEEETNFDLTITSITGQIIGTQKVNASQGFQTLSLSSFQLSNGTYIVCLESNHKKAYQLISIR